MKALTTRIALINEHQIVIDGLQSLLRDYEHLEVVIATTDPDELIHLLTTRPVDMLLSDLMLPDSQALLKNISRLFPCIKIIALNMGNRNSMIAGTEIPCYILKYMGKQELITALDDIAGSNSCNNQYLLQHVTARRKENSQNHLTDRELEIIRLIEQEYNNKKIAEKLFISQRTVETHRKNIFRKTGTNGVIGLIKYVYEHKLV